MSLEDAVLEMIKNKPGCSFVELSAIDGFAGNLSYKMKKNCILWHRISQEGAQCLTDLLSKKKITMNPAPVIVYLIDGVMIKLPIAKNFKEYKHEKWLPVAFSINKNYN